MPKRSITNEESLQGVSWTRIVINILSGIEGIIMSTILHPGVNCLKVGCDLLDTTVRHYLLKTLKNVSDILSTTEIYKSFHIHTLKYSSIPPPYILGFQRRLPKEDFGFFKISEQSLQDSPRWEVQLPASMQYREHPRQKNPLSSGVRHHKPAISGSTNTAAHKLSSKWQETQPTSRHHRTCSIFDATSLSLPLSFLLLPLGPIIDLT